MDNDSALRCDISIFGLGSSGELDRTYTEDAVLAKQLDELITDFTLGIAFGIRGDVAHVADMSDLAGGTSMCLAEWIEMWSSRRAAIGVVAELVNVEASFGIWVKALQVIGDLGGRGGVFLGESDGSRHVGVTTEKSNFN